MIIVVTIILGLIIALFAIYAYRVYKYSIIPRYSNDKGMELYADYEIDHHSKELGCYYGDFIKGIRKFDRDQTGAVRWLNHRGTGETIYNPTMVAEWALITHDRYLHTKKDEDLEDFKNQVEWLMYNATAVSEDKVCWYYEFDFGPEKAPWGSAIAQGMAICALLRAYQFFEDSRYFEMAVKSFNLLDTDYQQGGFRFQDDQYTLWYEEDNFQTHILNGHIYALYGVHDLYRVTGEEHYKKCFEKGVETIKNRITDFDLGFNTKYDAKSPYPANNSYHYTHITQFRILYPITNDLFFKEYADRFERYFNHGQYKIMTFFYILKLDLINKLKTIS